MASPQTENGYMRIATEVIEKIYKQPLTSSEFRVLFFVLRKTWGWGKKSDNISLSQIAKEVGIPRSNSCDVVSSLVAKRLLVKTKGKINTLQFNKNHEDWLVAKRRPPSRHHTTTLVATTRPVLVATVRHTIDTIKDTITKDISTNVLTGFGKPEINEISSYFLKVFQLPEEDCPKGQSRQYWNHLIRASKTGVSGVKWLIDQAYQDEFYRNNITSSKDLYYKRVKIVARKRGDIPKVAVMPKEVI